MITVIFTCYNRLGKTRNCIKSITEGNPSLSFSFVILDDASTDGTEEMLRGCRADGMDILLLHGDGNDFWAGGMRRAIAAARIEAANGMIGSLTSKEKTTRQYYLLVNDDVDFYPHAIESMILEYEKSTDFYALVGATCAEDKSFSYGGIRYDKGIHYTAVTPEDEDRSCDAFNMNCLCMDAETFLAAPEFDTHYVHSLADFDYGLSMKRMGIRSEVAPFYVGVCEKNAVEGTWLDKSLSRRERLIKKGGPKGAPLRPWFYFLRKNFGLKCAVIHGFTPFVRILLGR